MAAHADLGQHTPGGRAKRIVRWFACRDAAETYQREKTNKILTIGTAGIPVDAVLKTDALDARQMLASPPIRKCSTNVPAGFLAGNLRRNASSTLDQKYSRSYLNVPAEA